MSDVETTVRRGRTAAERKRDQRLRQEIQRVEGKPPLTAETMQMALMDALTMMLHSPHHAVHAEMVIHDAGTMLWDSKRTRAEIRKRLMRRLPKVYKESQ